MAEKTALETVMLDTTEDPRSLPGEGALLAGAVGGSILIRLMAASPRSPLAVALRRELEAMAPSERPILISLMRRGRGSETAPFATLGPTRILRARGGGALREQVLTADGLWIGRPLSSRRPSETARRLERGAAPDAYDAAILAFETAWALSTPSPFRAAVDSLVSALSFGARGKLALSDA